MNPAQALTAILQNGPVDSKAALVAMSERGFTAKQSRRAREGLGVEVARAGFGPRMSSTWQMPVGTVGDPPAPTAPTIAHEPAAASTPRAQVRRSVHTESITDDAPLSDEDQRRIDRRVLLFVGRSLAAGEARRVAIAIVHRRDRGGPDCRAIGSCVECQVRDQCKDVRPFGDVHECWAARLDGP